MQEVPTPGITNIEIYLHMEEIKTWLAVTYWILACCNQLLALGKNLKNR